MVAAFYLVDST